MGSGRLWGLSQEKEVTTRWQEPRSAGEESPSGVASPKGRTAGEVQGAGSQGLGQRTLKVSGSLQPSNYGALSQRLGESSHAKKTGFELASLGYFVNNWGVKF